MIRSIVGIDPGQNGGIVALEWDGQEAYPRFALRMPRTSTRDAGPGLPPIDLSRLLEVFQGFPAAVFAIEELRAMPVFGSKGARGAGTTATSKSNFALGRAYGQIEALLTATAGRTQDRAHHAIVRVSPQRWQAALLPRAARRAGQSTKAASIQRALQLFPSLTSLVHWKGNTPIPDGIADAALIALYTYRLHFRNITNDSLSTL